MLLSPKGFENGCNPVWPFLLRILCVRVFVFGARVCASEAMELAKHADMGSLHGAGVKHMQTRA